MEAYGATPGDQAVLRVLKMKALLGMFAQGRTIKENAVRKKVMWATDGSDSADRALPLAKTIATESHAPLVVVYSEEFTLPGKGGGSVPVKSRQMRRKNSLSFARTEGGIRNRRSFS